MAPKKFMDPLLNDSDLSESESDGDQKATAGKPPPRKQKLDIETLKKHGYSGGPSVLLVPEANDNVNWAWSSGAEKKGQETTKEDYDQREKNRDAVTVAAEESAKFAEKARQQAELLRQERKAEVYQQKERNKRDKGQSRGKSFVEEEKRKGREAGANSEFD